ncbi:hypothetical protein [Sphingomonas sp.]|uniref:hypothetical protein n=1 Tax=Sphingomonas sp. TaxID=28214 RepID=UPI000DB8362C|nr:hypothetical protein [Sphingomonas sp.]PZU10054.1 MAG: hypothetical protein DI605_05485 [Sphingomonas sp.]
MSAALPIGAAIGARKQRGSADNPTDPVRSYSYDVDDRRAQPWRRIGGGLIQEGIAFRKAMKRVIDELEMAHTKGGHRGAYRITADRAIVLKKMVDFLDHKTGQLDPSWERLADASGRGRGTVDRALEAGERHGLFGHVRRSVKIDGAEGQRRPQRKQTSSAIYFDLQRRMAPDIYASWWKHYLAELAKFGRWFKSRARRILSTFNGDAAPSPREPKVHRLVARARREVPPQPARMPVEARPGRPANIEAEAPTPAPGQPSAALRAILERTARNAFGRSLDEIENEGPK